MGNILSILQEYSNLSSQQADSATLLKMYTVLINKVKTFKDGYTKYINSNKEYISESKTIALFESFIKSQKDTGQIGIPSSDSLFQDTLNDFNILLGPSKTFDSFFSEIRTSISSIVLGSKFTIQPPNFLLLIQGFLKLSSYSSFNI